MQNKARLTDFLKLMSAADSGALDDVLSDWLATEARSSFYFPFDDAVGPLEAAESFWHPLRHSFPDYEIRPGLLLQGTYEDRTHASLLGFVVGNFVRPFAGIAATKKMAVLRFAMNVVFDGGRILASFAMFDLVELMRKSGRYPFSIMPGASVEWLFPPAATASQGGANGKTALTIVREMQRGLPKGPAVVDRATAAAHHSPHWAETMNWFGPAGIGSSRGMAGFRDSHGALFLKAFPDRCGLPRKDPETIRGQGHFCEIGDGPYAMTAGWPNMRGRHTGSGWLGLPPTGREVEMRVADWYRLDEKGKLADNWVMIDIPHIADQLGLNIFEELAFIDDPSRPRLR